MAPRVRLSNTTTVSEVFLKASRERDFEKIKACLTLGVDINSRDSDDHTALYYSLFGLFDQKIFDLLIEHPGLDVDQINEERMLLVAVVSGTKVERLRKLCQLPGKNTSLHKALFHKNS